MNDSSKPARRNAFSALFALATLSGCAAISPPPQGTVFERDGVSVVVIPSGSRETYFSDPKALERHCRAPSPDVSVTASEGISLNMPSLVGKGIGVNEDASTASLGLGGRNPAVLISRELLYRACELSNNLGLPPDQALSLFRDAMDAIVRISAGHGGSGTLPAFGRPLDPRVQPPNPSLPPATGPNTSAPGTLPSVVPGTSPATGGSPARW